MCGDFFQLPPVAKGGIPKFAFEAQMWSDCVERTFNLTKVFRQKEQRQFNLSTGLHPRLNLTRMMYSMARRIRRYAE